MFTGRVIMIRCALTVCLVFTRFSDIDTPSFCIVKFFGWNLWCVVHESPCLCWLFDHAAYPVLVCILVMCLFHIRQLLVLQAIAVMFTLHWACQTEIIVGLLLSKFEIRLWREQHLTSCRLTHVMVYIRFSFVFTHTDITREETELTYEKLSVIQK